MTGDEAEAFWRRFMAKRDAEAGRVVAESDLDRLAESDLDQLHESAAPEVLTESDLGPEHASATPEVSVVKRVALAELLATPPDQRGYL